MKWDISDLTRREAKVVLFIDGDFKYDDVEKAKKLHLYFQNKNIFRSNSARRFERKFMEYIETGIPSGSCPLCNSFLEGKRRLLCSKCVDRLENFVAVDDVQPNIKVVKENTPVKQPEAKPQKVNVVQETNTKEINKIYIKNEDDEPIIISNENYVIIPKRKFYISMAGAIALALIVNFLIALPYFFSTDSVRNEIVSEISNEEVPTSGK